MKLLAGWWLRWWVFVHQDGDLSDDITFLSVIARTKSVKPLQGMYWLGLTDIAAEGVWLDNYGNEVDMSTMSATIDNAGGNQHCLAWFLTVFRLTLVRYLRTGPSQKPSVRRDLWSNYWYVCSSGRGMYSASLSICMYWSLGWWWHMWWNWHSLHCMGKHSCSNIWWKRKWYLRKCNLYFITNKSRCNRQFRKVFILSSFWK